jgi:NTP pyrophosphatase (non-canonical NTP hydrolase)
MDEFIKYIMVRNGIKKIMEKFNEETQELKDAYRVQDINNLKEELADVLLICEQIKQYYEFTDEEMQAIRDFKIDRTIKQLKIDIGGE